MLKVTKLDLSDQHWVTCNGCSLPVTFGQTWINFLWKQLNNEPKFLIGTSCTRVTNFLDFERRDKVFWCGLSNTCYRYELHWKKTSPANFWNCLCQQYKIIYWGLGWGGPNCQSSSAEGFIWVQFKHWIEKISFRNGRLCWQRCVSILGKIPGVVTGNQVPRHPGLQVWRNPEGPVEIHNGLQCPL